MARIAPESVLSSESIACAANERWASAIPTLCEGEVLRRLSLFSRLVCCPATSVRVPLFPCTCRAPSTGEDDNRSISRNLSNTSPKDYGN